MTRVLRSWIAKLVDRIYFRDAAEAPEAIAEVQAWVGRYRGVIKPAVVWPAVCSQVLATLWLYLMAPPETGIIYPATNALIALLLISQALPKPPLAIPLVFFLVTQVAILGLGFGLYTYLDAAPKVAESMIGAVIYVSMGLLMIHFTPLYNGTVLLLAFEHFVVGVLAWAFANQTDRLGEWSLVLIHFDMFSVMFHVLSHRQVHRHALVQVRAKQLERANEQLRVAALEKDMVTAQQIQDSLAPSMSELMTPHTQVTFYQKRFDIVGGDWVGMRSTAEGSLVVAVADVTGKGISAAMVAQAINSLWARTLSKPHFDPVVWINEVNATLIIMGHSEPYTATLGVAVINADTVLYYSAGHVPLFLAQRQDGKRKFLSIPARGNMLGMSEELDLTPGSFELRGSAIESMFLGTDGIFSRGSRLRERAFNELLLDIEARGAEALASIPETDDKVLIWVKRLPAATILPDPELKDVS